LNTPTPEHPADYCSCCCGLATPRVTSRMSQGNGFVWQDRWDQCWHLLTDHLAARDLICLCLSSRSLLSRSNSTGGWWQQACSSCLSWPPPSCNSSNSSSFAATPQPGSSTISAEADQRARQVLLSATALAHHLQHCRWTPAQTVQIPPWLPGQPGRSRGFVRLDPSSLDPPLLLKPTELNWLAHGSLSGQCTGVCVLLCLLLKC
jgi:hypothetical protein